MRSALEPTTPSLLLRTTGERCAYFKGVPHTSQIPLFSICLAQSGLSVDLIPRSTRRLWPETLTWHGVGHVAVFAKDSTVHVAGTQPWTIVELLRSVSLTFDRVRRIFSMRSEDLVKRMVDSVTIHECESPAILQGAQL